jgi:hypothetical protein
MFHSLRPTEIRAQYRQRAGGERQDGRGGDPNQSADSYHFSDIREYNWNFKRYQKIKLDWKRDGR